MQYHMPYTVKTFIGSEPSTADKKLSFCLKPDGFSFTIITKENHLISYCDVAMDTQTSIATVSSDIKSLFAEKKLAIFGYTECELIVQTSLSSWVPEHLYERGRERQYLSLIGNIKPGTTCYSDYNELLKSYVVFSADSTAVSAFKITFPGIKVRCQYSKLVRPEFVQQVTPVMMLNIRKDCCDIVASKGGQLQLSNTYACVTLGDAIYCTLNIMKMLGLESPDSVLWLSGEVNKTVYAAFAKYFPSIRLFTGCKFECENTDFLNLHTYRDVLVFC